ncbi:MAG: sel1 repeat family protein [Deltaproteobacteria bacterium]|jgi:TPR repeat protein|nr:sel1 repeat family protein [Deltaproteobacteria bacterium]
MAGLGGRKAMRNLGVAHKLGDMVPQDSERAVEWWRESVIRGFAPVMNHLGWAYRSRSGVNKDRTKSLKYWKQAVANGCKPAFFSLDLAHFFGLGTPVD